MQNLIAAIEAAKAKNTEARQTRIKRKHITALIQETNAKLVKQYGQEAIKHSDAKAARLLRPHIQAYGYDRLRLLMDYAIVQWDRHRNDIFRKWHRVPDYPLLPFVLSAGVFAAIEQGHRRDVDGSIRGGDTNTYAALEKNAAELQKTVEALKGRLQSATAEIAASRKVQTELRRALDANTRQVVEMKSKLTIASNRPLINTRKSRSPSELLPAEIAFADAANPGCDPDHLHEWDMFP